MTQDEMELLNGTAGSLLSEILDGLSTSTGFVLVTFEFGGSVYASGQTCEPSEAIGMLRRAADDLELALMVTN